MTMLHMYICPSHFMLCDQFLIIVLSQLFQLLLHSSLLLLLLSQQLWQLSHPSQLQCVSSPYFLLWSVPLDHLQALGPQPLIEISVDRIFGFLN